MLIEKLIDKENEYNKREIKTWILNKNSNKKRKKKEIKK